MSGQKLPISRKRIAVEKISPRELRFSLGRFCARYPGEGAYGGPIAWGETADAAREEAVRQLVLTGRYVDPRPASRGGAQ